MLKRKPANEYYQMLTYHIGQYEPKQNNIDFKSANDVLWEADKKWLRKDDLRGYRMR